MSQPDDFVIGSVSPIGCDLTDENLAATIALKVFADQRYNDIVRRQRSLHLSSNPDPRIITPPADDVRGVPDPTPHRGRDNYSELPLSDSVPAGRQIAGEAQPDARSNSHKF